MIPQLLIVPHFREKQTPVPLGVVLEGDTRLLIRCFAAEVDPAESERLRALRILDDLAAKGAWLMCQCTGKADGPIMYPQRTRGGQSRMLVRNYDRREHHEECPFYRLRSERIAPETPLVRVERHTGAFALLKETTPGETQEEEREGPQRAGERAPMLRRLLFRVIEEAGLNQFPATGPADVNTQYERLRQVLETLYFDSGQTVPLKDYTFVSLDRLEWLQERLGRKKPWPKPLEPQGFLIGVATEVGDRTLTTSKGTILQVAGKIARFGEENTAGPFIGMVLVGMDRNTKQYGALRAYIHPVHSSQLLIPVDSNLERRTMNLLKGLQSWLHRDKHLDVLVEKPLADMPTGRDTQPIRPDFLVKVNQKVVVVETMGYDDAEYLAKKSRTHPLMERIGKVVQHRSGEDADRLFKSEVSKAIFAANR